MIERPDTLTGLIRQIVPIMKERLQSPDPSARTGVCMGLREVMASANKNHIGAYMTELIPAVKDALCDTSEVSAMAKAQSALLTLCCSLCTRTCVVPPAWRLNACTAMSASVQLMRLCLRLLNNSTRYLLAGRS